MSDQQQKKKRQSAGASDKAAGKSDKATRKRKPNSWNVYQRNCTKDTHWSTKKNAEEYNKKKKKLMDILVSCKTAWDLDEGFKAKIRSLIADNERFKAEIMHEGKPKKSKGFNRKLQKQPSTLYTNRKHKKE